MSQTRKQKRVKKDIPEYELRDLYYNQGLSQRDIAKKYGFGQTTVRRIMDRYGISPRKGKESKQTKAYSEKAKVLAQRYQREYTVHEQKICQYCGNTFDATGSQRKNKYCSEQCRKNAIRERSAFAQQTCALCGNPIIQTGRLFKRKYCNECQGKWRRIALKNRVKTTCAYCGKEIEVIPSVFKKNEQCYCSVECMANGYKTRFSGENSPTWKGGKSHHYTGNFYKARKEARERDKFTCQLCGITEEEYGHELSVHHIESYRHFKDKKEANKLDNLVSLCEPCHRFVHSKKNTNGVFIKKSD